MLKRIFLLIFPFQEVVIVLVSGLSGIYLSFCLGWLPKLTSHNTNAVRSRQLLFLRRVHNTVSVLFLSIVTLLFAGFLVSFLDFFPPPSSVSPAVTSDSLVWDVIMDLPALKPSACFMTPGFTNDSEKSCNKTLRPRFTVIPNKEANLCMQTRCCVHNK